MLDAAPRLNNQQHGSGLCPSRRFVGLILAFKAVLLRKFRRASTGLNLQPSPARMSPRWCS